MSNFHAAKNVRKNKQYVSLLLLLLLFFFFKYLFLDEFLHLDQGELFPVVWPQTAWWNRGVNQEVPSLCIHNRGLCEGFGSIAREPNRWKNLLITRKKKKIMCVCEVFFLVCVRFFKVFFLGQFPLLLSQYPRIQLIDWGKKQTKKKKKPKPTPARWVVTTCLTKSQKRHPSRRFPAFILLAGASLIR